MDHVTLAGDLFLEGFNCAQAVAVAFTDLTGMDKSEAAKLASPFGGGMGHTKNTCGAITGGLSLRRRYGPYAGGLRRGQRYVHRAGSALRL